MTNLQLYYTDFVINSYYKIPETLQHLIYNIWIHKYEEIYEDIKNPEISLEEACNEILDFAEGEEAYIKYIFMAIILAEAVKPTVKAYLPDDTRTEQVYELIYIYLEKNLIFSPNNLDKIFPRIAEGPQAINEALDVFRNLLRVSNALQVKEALLEILDDCLEGYAIFPGSQGRRDLFNWWLLEVVPATWCLQLPQHIYTIKGLCQFQPSFNVSKLINKVTLLQINN